METALLLQGLLEKDMTKRLDWPKLAQHPFVSLDEELTRAGEPGFPNRLQGGLEVIAGETRSHSMGQCATLHEQRQSWNAVWFGTASLWASG